MKKITSTESNESTPLKDSKETTQDIPRVEEIPSPTYTYLKGEKNYPWKAEMPTGEEGHTLVTNGNTFKEVLENITRMLVSRALPPLPAMQESHFATPEALTQAVAEMMEENR